MCFWLVSCLLYAMQQCIAPCKRIAIAVNTFRFLFVMHGAVKCVCVCMFRCFPFWFVLLFPFFLGSHCALPCLPSICMTIWLCVVIYHKFFFSERWKNSHPNQRKCIQNTKQRKEYQGMSVAFWPQVLVSFLVFFSLFFLFFNKKWARYAV